MNMHEVMERLLKLYDKGLEEMMGAQEYIRCAEHAKTEEDKSMYKALAKQELEHGEKLMAAGDREPMLHSEEGRMLKTMWEHLKRHLVDWQTQIAMRIGTM